VSVTADRRVHQEDGKKLFTRLVQTRLTEPLRCGARDGRGQRGRECTCVDRLQASPTGWSTSSCRGSPPAPAPAVTGGSTRAAGAGRTGRTCGKPAVTAARTPCSAASAADRRESSGLGRIFMSLNGAAQLPGRTILQMPWACDCWPAGQLHRPLRGRREHRTAFARAGPFDKNK
jgi:hypothetical protein